MKKILLISFEYPIGKAYCGGVGQIVRQNRKALLELGYDVYVLISFNFSKKRPVKLLFPDGSLRRYRNLGGFLRDYEWPKFSRIIHHFVNLTGELKKVKGQKGRRPRIIYHFHSILRRERDSGFRTLNHFLHNQERMIQLADEIICPSAYEYDNFVRYFPSFVDKLVVIENTVERLAADKSRIKEIKQRHSIKKDDIVSLYVGRLEKIKGAHILIKEAPQVLKRHRHLKLFLIGRSLEQGLYKKLMRLCRQFPGQLFYKRYLEKRELFQYFYLSDIYINTSLSESFSLSTHESALCNNALLLNRLPVLEKFRDAALFCGLKKGDFARKYEELIRDGALRNRLSRRAAVISARQFNKNRLKQDLLQLFSYHPAEKN